MNLSKHYGVYGIICQVNGRVYVGMTVKSFTKRWGQHRNMLRQGKHYNNALQSDWTAFGADAFSFEVLFALLMTPSWPIESQEAYEVEKDFIQQYASVRYNVVDERNVNRNWVR